MFSSNRNIFIICNSILLAYGISLFFPLGDYINAFLINALIFMIPGLGWVGLLRRQTTDAVVLTFFMFFVSTVSVLLLLGVQVLLPIEPRPLVLWAGILVITNIGIFKTHPSEVFKDYHYDVKEVIIIILSMVCIFSCVYTGMKKIPEKIDLDGEHQGSAYGMIYELKPYLTSDVVPSAFYFAHPPLTNFYNALSTFLLNKIDDFKYFYDTAKQTEEILHLKEGEQIPVVLGNKKYDVQKFNDEYYSVQRMHVNDLRVGMYNADRLMGFLTHYDQNQFLKNPQVFPARCSNIFASIFIFFLLFKLITYLTNSRLLGIVAGYCYIFSPGIFIRSCYSEHVAFTNCILVLLAYQFIRPDVFNMKKGALKYFRFIPGIMAGLINQKIIIFMMPLFLMVMWKAWKDKEGGSAVSQMMKNASILIGFAAGSLLFWAYGIILDHQAFIASHLHVHLFDRLFHANTMFADDYPGIQRLWYEFNIEFPLFFIAVFAMFYCFKRYASRNTVFLLMWIICGGIVFSLVDWKQTNHLTIIVPPMIMCTMVYIEEQKLTYKRILKILVGLTLVYSFCFDIRLINDFSLYIPTSNW